MPTPMKRTLLAVGIAVFVSMMLVILQTIFAAVLLAVIVNLLPHRK
jgi:hypothetical protein